MPDGSVRPGDVHVFEPGHAIAIGVGVWAQRQGSAIQVHLTGPQTCTPPSPTIEHPSATTARCFGTYGDFSLPTTPGRSATRAPKPKTDPVTFVDQLRVGPRGQLDVPVVVRDRGWGLCRMGRTRRTISSVRGLPAARIPAWLADARIGSGVSLAVLIALTGLLAPMVGDDEITVVTMVFLLVVLLGSALWGYVVGLASAVLADLLLNFFFVTPLHTFTVQEVHNVVALVVFLAVAVVGASMLALFRRQLAVADARRAELAVMLDLSRQLASSPSPRLALDALAQSITRALGARRCHVMQRSGSDWQIAGSSGVPVALTRDEIVLANLAVESGEVARQLEPRLGRIRLQLGHRWAARQTVVPFRSGAGVAGALQIMGEVSVPDGGDLDALLRGIADEAGAAVHRAWLTEQAGRADVIQRSDEFKSVLLSSVSHDLRSPLTAIKAAVGSLRSDGIEWTDEDRGEMLATIESQTDRLTNTVTDLLDMGRLESGSVQVNLEPVNVRALLDDVALATATTTTGRRVSVDAGDDVWARVDHGLMLRAMINLVENAAKYSDPAGAIALSCENTHGRVVLSVGDNGPGISREDVPFIFEKFYRGSAGKKTLGSGLGLSIVKAMVELNRGRITVESRESGTTVRISLPAAGPPQ